MPRKLIALVALLSLAARNSAAPAPGRAAIRPRPTLRASPPVAIATGPGFNRDKKDGPTIIELGKATPPPPGARGRGRGRDKARGGRAAAGGRGGRGDGGGRGGRGDGGGRGGGASARRERLRTLCAAVRAGAWAEAEQMLESTRWSVNEYRASLQAASQVGDWRGARRLLTHMQAEGGHPPDAAAAAHAIGACHRAKRPKEVLELLQSLEEAGVTPELRSYNMGISASGRVGDWRTAIELLRSMGLNDVPPSVVSYNAALSALGRGGRWQQALELLEEMDRKRGVEADGARRRAIRPRNSAAQFCRAIPPRNSGAILSRPVHRLHSHLVLDDDHRVPEGRRVGGGGPPAREDATNASRRGEAGGRRDHRRARRPLQAAARRTQRVQLHRGDVGPLR